MAGKRAGRCGGGIKKRAFGCGQCHTLARPLMSTHTAEEFEEGAAAHGELCQPDLPAINSGPQQSGPGLADPLVNGRPNPLAVSGFDRFRHSKTHSFELKGFARPKGVGTKVVITEYDLPRRTMQPHDVIVDGTGTIWAGNFGENSLIKLDVKTGKVTEYPTIGRHGRAMPTAISIWNATATAIYGLA